jgi:hypothetical protein
MLQAASVTTHCSLATPLQAVKLAPGCAGIGVGAHGAEDGIPSLERGTQGDQHAPLGLTSQRFKA